MLSVPASAGTDGGQAGVFDTKQIPVAVSQQFEFGPAGGQLFWQSASDMHEGTHIPPPLAPLLAAVPVPVLVPVAAALPAVAEPAPPAPPIPASKRLSSLPEAQATMPEGRRVRARTVTLTYLMVL